MIGSVSDLVILTFLHTTFVVYISTCNLVYESTRIYRNRVNGAAHEVTGHKQSWKTKNQNKKVVLENYNF